MTPYNQGTDYQHQCVTATARLNSCTEQKYLFQIVNLLQPYLTKSSTPLNDRKKSFLSPKVENRTVTLRNCKLEEQQLRVSEFQPFLICPVGRPDICVQKLVCLSCVTFEHGAREGTTSKIHINLSTNQFDVAIQYFLQK